VLVFGTPPSITHVSITLMCGFVIAYLGFVWFQKSRKGFADVL